MNEVYIGQLANAKGESDGSWVVALFNRTPLPRAMWLELSRLQQQAADKFADTDLASIRNPSGFFVGIQLCRHTIGAGYYRSVIIFVITIRGKVSAIIIIFFIHLFVQGLQIGKIFPIPSSLLVLLHDVVRQV